jgi:hypothetical protein
MCGRRCTFRNNVYGVDGADRVDGADKPGNGNGGISGGG